MTRWKVSLLLFALLLLALPIIYNFYGWPLVRAIGGGGALGIIFLVLFGGKGPNDTFTFSGNSDGGFDGGGDGGGGFDGGGGGGD